MIKQEIFANKYLSVQTQRNKYQQRIFYMLKLINRDNTKIKKFANQLFFKNLFGWLLEANKR